MKGPKRTHKIVGFLLCFALMVTLLGTGLIVPGNEIHVDASSSATGSSGGGSSSSSTTVATGEYSYEKYTLPSGITGPKLMSVMNSTPLFYKNGDSYTQLMCYCMSNYAYYFYLNGNSYSNSAALGYGYDTLEIKDSTVMNNLYAGTPTGGSSGGTTVTGEVAQDGVYTNTVRVYKYKKGKLKDTYYGTVYVAVQNGTIVGLWIRSSESKVEKLITDEIYYAYVGKEASEEAITGVDAVSSSSISTNGGTGASDAVSSASVNTSKDKYYTSNLQAAILEAIRNAPKVEIPEEEPEQEAEAVYTGTSEVDDSEGSKLVLKVSVADGKILDIAADEDASTGSWDSLISKVKSEYVGKSAEEILAADAVSGATKYSTAVDEAVRAALKQASENMVRLAGYTTSLNGTISMNFYMELGEKVAADEDARMEFDLPGGNHTEEMVSLSSARKSNAGGKTYYIFPAGVAAKDMTSDITAKFVWSGGESGEYVYSIRDYCDYIRDHTDDYDAESVELVGAMLNYGGYAQEYFNYNTSDLANTGLNRALPKSGPGSEYDATVSGTCTGASYLGSQAVLTTTTSIKYYFTLEGDTGNYSVTADGKGLTIQSDSNGNYVLVDNIKAKDLGTNTTIVVKNKTDQTSLTLKSSVYSNIRQVVENSSSKQTSVNMMKALYDYGEAAKAYIASRS